MKKLRNLCIAIIALVGLSSSAFAQGTGIAPAIGTTHSYWVNSTSTDGSSIDSGKENDYLWYITKGNLTTLNSSDFAIGTTSYVDDKTAVKDLNAIDITWAAASAGSTYYLHIIETNKAELGGCSNHKVEIIKPFSDFQLAIVNLDFDTTNKLVDAADDNKVCAPDVALSLNATTSDVEYGYGTTALYYKVNATNIAAASYDLVYNINVAVEFSGSAVIPSYSTDGGTSYSNLPAFVDNTTDATQTITNAANSSEVIIKVELVNGAGFEGLTSHDVTVKLVSGTQSAALATIPTAADQVAKKQIVPARPSTSGIGSN